MTDKIEITRDMANTMIREVKDRVRFTEAAFDRPLTQQELFAMLDGVACAMRAVALNYDSVLVWLTEESSKVFPSEAIRMQETAKVKRMKRKYLLRNDVYQAIMDLMPYGGDGCDSEFNNGRYFATGVIMGRLGNIPVREIEDE